MKRAVVSIAAGLLVVAVVSVIAYRLADRDSGLTAAEAAVIRENLFTIKDPAENASRLARYQDARAQCMAEAGFTVPVRHPVVSRLPRYDDRQGLPDRAFAQQWGFAVFTDKEIEDEEFSVADPTAVSTTESDAYYTAMFGSWRKDPEGGVVPKNALGGCAGKALQASNPIMYAMNELPPKAQQSYRAMNQQIVSDPKVVAAVGTWRKCMASNGYDVGDATYDSMAPWLESRKKVTESGTRTVRIQAFENEKPQTVTVPKYDAKSLAEATSFERAVAKVALDCSDAEGLDATIHKAWQIRQDLWLKKYSSELADGAKLELAAAASTR
ncbi:hypothetical protein [Actinoplanes teichomyceticus]|uniref:Uncharacterized protein n=1 Tax=Actinoplanes teichomyceticus TaxID=1867 RepID=A0A561WQQ3_ACTTI|nr:hypothetical protein [Actinoplanes teichomyceticus]TWG26179.1 hypothetical protein FHX34_1011157 [Actinoplanes teichomyceticus]